MGWQWSKVLEGLFNKVILKRGYVVGQEDDMEVICLAFAFSFFIPLILIEPWEQKWIVSDFYDHFMTFYMWMKRVQGCIDAFVFMDRFTS